MSRAAGNVLVLGIGNLLMRDDGVGVHVVQRLIDDQPRLPDDVRVVDGGTLGLDLLPLVDEARALVVVDAVDLRARPGTVRILRDAELNDTPGGHLSPHQVGLRDLLAVGRLTGRLPDRLALVAVQPAAIEPGLDLTAACRAAVPRAVAAVRAEIDVVRAVAGAA